MLSPLAEQIIHNYLNLPFQGIVGVRCPYFNNARRRARGQLRALIGKGTPQEIVDEALIVSHQYHHQLFDHAGHFCAEHVGNNTELAREQLRKFLIDHDLGIDCSGFAVHVLRAHYLETKKIDIAKRIHIVPPYRLFRYLASKLRPIENIGVSVLAKNENSTVVEWQHAEPGDMIIMLATGPRNTRNHILLVTDHSDDTISYVHARAWTNEGQYHHGISRGTVKVIDRTQNVLNQEWEENGCNNETNETYLEAKNAQVLAIRRLKIS